MSGSLEIVELNGRRGTSRFVDAAWTVHDQPVSSGWVPPLRAVVRDGLDRRGNPFYQRAERALFIAKRGGRPVGRVAAIENRWHNEHHDDRVGFFGFFECRDDQEAANALFERAEGWLGGRGLRSVRGPVSPSMNHECGVLVDGLDFPPVIMTPWNPAYYGTLIEGAGYSCARDLLGYYLPAGDEMVVPDRVRRLAERTLQKTRLVFRAWDFDTMEEEVRAAFDLYCDAWEGNWGFVPPSWEEFWHIAKDLKSVMHPDFAFRRRTRGKKRGLHHDRTRHQPSASPDTVRSALAVECRTPPHRTPPGGQRAHRPLGSQARIPQARIFSALCLRDRPPRGEDSGRRG